MNLHPAFLFIGSEQDCARKASELIMQALCKKKGCHKCADCRALVQKQHYLQLWLSPDSSYTLSQLEAVFQITSFALQPGEHYFIVFERADLFTQVTANSLLKLLEEPPWGYHFILLAPRAEGILPTVISRCLVEILPYKEDQSRHPLFRFFTSSMLDDSGDFAKELDRHKGLDRDIPFLLDQLTVFWHQRMHVNLESGNETEYTQARACEAILQEARLMAPLAGNTKIFLKNLYLQFLEIAVSAL